MDTKPIPSPGTGPAKPRHSHPRLIEPQQSSEAVAVAVEPAPPLPKPAPFIDWTALGLAFIGVLPLLAGTGLDILKEVNTDRTHAPRRKSGPRRKRLP